MMAPASTPDAVVAKLSADVLTIMVTSDMDERARAQGFRVDARGPQAFSTFLSAELDRGPRIIAAPKITTA